MNRPGRSSAPFSQFGKSVHPFWEIGALFWEIGALFWEIGALFWEIGAPNLG